jgi:hypothetical protein
MKQQASSKFLKSSNDVLEQIWQVGFLGRNAATRAMLAFWDPLEIQSNSMTFLEC